LVLELLEKESLNAEQLATIFEPVTKRPEREVWLSSKERAVSARPPVLTPAETAAQGDAPVVPQDEAAAAHDEHPAVQVVEVPPEQTPTPGLPD
ncbi:MAG: cell division protein FtsH, partial [Actinobacteria bacterium]|nr:cell division protein FtsH [Actinomycetota bacterium]MCG2802777.1 cell division protein FtsH [Cellulomonas sp.]